MSSVLDTASHLGLDPLVVELPTGMLRLELEGCAGQAADLLGFAARANPRRAFLFLSKVLGKHYPAAPAAMEAVHRALAAQVPEPGGPVVFVGMAETATGLGQGVFEAWLEANPGHPALYLQTTRYRIEGADCLTFEESHSHAPRVFLHLPKEDALRARLRDARSVVLVDDELSTGNTFVNLVAVLRSVMPEVASVHLATISDFMGEARRCDIARRMGVACSIGSLLRGFWHFEPNGNVLGAVAPAQCADGMEIQLEDVGYGRLGRDTALSVPPALVQALVREPVAGPTLVLGTGEFMQAAFVLGRALERHGVDVRVQATTRSPILRWGAVAHVLSVPDPYGEVPNYLYNVAPGQYARVLVCHETSPSERLRDLALTLDARLIHFKRNDHAEEIPVR